MVMGTPVQPVDPIISQNRQQHLSHDPLDLNQQDSLPSSSSPILPGIHVSPFNLTIGESNHLEPSSDFDDPLTSLPVPDISLAQETNIFPAQCSTKEKLPSSMTKQQHASSSQLVHDDGFIDGLDPGRSSQPFESNFQSIPSQNVHQPRNVGHFVIQSESRAINPIAYPDYFARDINSGLTLDSVAIASNPGLEVIAQNVHPSTQAVFMNSLIPSIASNCADRDKPLDQIQPSLNPHIAGSAAQDFNRTHVSAPTLFDVDGLADTRDSNHIMHSFNSRPQQIPVADPLASINHEQSNFQQPLLSRSQYLSRPGQIYERVSSQPQLPFSSAALNSVVDVEVNQTNPGQLGIGSFPPFSHSISTHHPVPILPATKSVRITHEPASASAEVESDIRECEFCGKRFKSKKDLQRHIARMHVLKNRHPCSEPGCTQSFAEAHKLKRHFRTVHLKIRPFKCPECESAFGEKGNMAQHCRKAHGTESGRKRVKRC